MNILILGSGGREHALAWKISQSQHVDHLYIAPGNAGTQSVGQNVPLRIDCFDEIKHFVLHNDVHMVVVGPEDPLVKGIYDYFHSDDSLKDVAVIGPSQRGALLEGSKDFAKAFMMRHNIPTAAYRTFTSETLNEGLEFLKTLNPPYVLKADGLCAGKGVLILPTLEEAETELKKMLQGMFGEASASVVIEEFLNGIECSVFVLTDGQHYKILPEAKDYKRIGEHDTGLNTGGMGSVSPVPFANKEWMGRVEDQIIRPTIEGLASEGIDYKGFIFFGLINCDGQPKVIEYNARMGDPETESVMMRIESDLVDMLKGVADGNLDHYELVISPHSSACVVLVSGGYPESYEKGFTISGLDYVQDCVVFHAGTTLKNNIPITSGGRVLAVCAQAATQQEALNICYREVEKISFEKKYFRYDIGKDLL